MPNEILLHIFSYIKDLKQLANIRLIHPNLWDTSHEFIKKLNYLSKESPEELNHILKAFPSLIFFKLNYATSEHLEVILRSLPYLTTLELTGDITNEDLELIVKWLPHLEKLTINNSHKLTNCHALSQLKNLKQLNLAGCSKIQDIKLLKGSIHLNIIF